VNCIGTACGTGTTALGQNYFISADYCAAQGTPGTDSTYTLAMATAAAGAAPVTAPACSMTPCSGVSSCTTSLTAQDVYYVDDTLGSGNCYVWVFKTTGSGSTKAPSGHVAISTNCACPVATDPTWN
jgi:hypothetical protein